MTVWIHSPFDNLPQEGYRKQRYWLMAEAFVAAGHRVVYFTSNFNHGTKAPRVFTNREELNATSGVRLVLVPTRPYTRNVSLRRVLSHALYARRLERTARALVSSFGRPDLIVSATPTLGGARVCQKLAHGLGARFILDVQDAWPETFVRLLPRTLAPLGKLVFAPLYRTARRLYRTADHVTGVSARYQAICGRADYFLSYHGIEVPRERSVVRPRADSPRTALVYVGNLGEGYDLETVLRLLASDPALTLDIAGRGPREDALKALSKDLVLDGRVRFHGYLPKDKLNALLATAEIGVVPMRDDSWVGLPYKLGDYLVAGLPVVSSLHGECGELLARHRLGATYDFGSVPSLRAAVRQIRDLPPNVLLPDELNAARIYPAYVTEVMKGKVP